MGGFSKKAKDIGLWKYIEMDTSLGNSKKAIKKVYIAKWYKENCINIYYSILDLLKIHIEISCYILL